jgi:hypothetical protein
MEAPKGRGRSLPIRSKDALALAYYQTADGLGVLAPRGWYCEGACGSGGCVLALSPSPIERNPPHWAGLGGPAIEISHIEGGGGSGGAVVAEILARVFPTYRALGHKLWQIDEALPSGPFPGDTVTHKNRRTIEYTTAPQKDGLGTHFSWIRKSDSPVRGAAILLGSPPPDLLLLAVRLPPDLAHLTPVIMREVERESARRK